MKTLEAIHETLRNSKHTFRQADPRSGKEHKHRYERRKVKEFLRLSDWLTAEFD
jgi:hypothetical protein